LSCASSRALAPSAISTQVVVGIDRSLRKVRPRR
jgi:hypothetical protein